MRRVFLLLFSMIIMISGAACVSGEAIDKNKTQIYISLFDGGYGSEWLKKIKTQFEKDYPKYQILIDLNKTENASILQSIKNNSTNFNIFFTTAPYLMHDFIAQNLIHDLSDVYSAVLDGETVSVAQKTKNYESYQKAFGKEGKMYALPYGDSFTGLVYDHDLFTERGWLRTENGKWLYEDRGARLSVGKDGKSGTYDDGQPQTESQFMQMLALIKASNDSVPFIWSNNNAWAYTPPVTLSMIAQYEGISNFDLMYTFDGEYESPDGSLSFPITPEQGYKAFDMQGLEKSLKFTSETLGDSRYYHSSVLDYASHTDTQNTYLYSYEIAGASTLQPAMLVEGIWWENEARATFDSMDAGRRFGERNYNYMLLPDFEGQRGAFGNGKGSVFTAQDTGSVFISKNTNPELAAMCKEFLKYTLMEKNLKEFTIETGALKPFEYAMGESDRARMSKFANNVWEIYNDTENIKIVRPEILKLSSPMNYATSKADILYSKIGLNIYNYPLYGFATSKPISYTQYLNGIRSYNQTNWQDFYNDYSEYVNG